MRLRDERKAPVPGIHQVQSIAWNSDLEPDNLIQ